MFLLNNIGPLFPCAKKWTSLFLIKGPLTTFLGVSWSWIGPLVHYW